MTQVRKLSRRRGPRAPRTPLLAASCCGPLDDLLDPTLFKALCDPTRATLVACVAKCGRACTVSEIAECCRVDLSVVSRHLQLLERAGVVTSSRAGRIVHYLVNYTQLVTTLRALADALVQCAPGKCNISNGDASKGGCCAKS